MPEIQVRSMQLADLTALHAIDHRVLTEYAWQMEVFGAAEGEVAQIRTVFRKVRLPRPALIEHPWSALPGDGVVREVSPLAGLLTALHQGVPVGYIGLGDGSMGRFPEIAYITDMAVDWEYRRQGIGAGLLFAAEEWAHQNGVTRLVMELQSKNYPAIALAQKAGYDFCGYNDQYYPNRDIALFFGKPVL